MKIVRTVADSCPNGIDCPRIHELEDGRLLVRGYTVTSTTGLDLAPGESAVAMPAWLREQATASLDDTHHCRPTGRRHLHLVDPDTVLVIGETVTDPDVLLHLRLPLQEAAVVVPRSALQPDPVLIKEAS